MIIILVFLQCLIFAFFASGLSFFLYNEMDTGGILAWWGRYRDRRWPQNQDGTYRFFGAITGQCAYCMNQWLTILSFLVVSALWCDCLNEVEYLYRFVFALPVAVFSNLFLHLYFKLFAGE